MPSYEKELKRSKDGSIIRYVGYNMQGVPEKFRLVPAVAAGDEYSTDDCHFHLQRTPASEF